MSTITIDGLTTAATLAGTEELPVWQSGGTVKTTAQDIADLAPTPVIPGVAQAIGEETFVIVVADGAGSAWKNLFSSNMTEAGNTGAWARNPADGVLSAMGQRSVTSQASNNAPAVHYDAQAFTGVYRAISGGVAQGFSETWVFMYDDASATRRVFIGLVPGSSIAVLDNGNADPSAAPNILGIGKDSADANFQFMSNDGAGAATKVNTGLPVSSILGKACRFLMTAPRGVAAVTVVIEDLTNGVELLNATYTLGANVPVADTALQPVAGANSGPSAAFTAVVWRTHKLVMAQNT